MGAVWIIKCVVVVMFSTSAVLNTFQSKRSHECPMGTFGKHCTLKCSPYCNSSYCNQTFGDCMDGCVPGYVGRFCNASCPNGTFGEDCEGTCGQCNLIVDNVTTENRSCDPETGRCLYGCRNGFAGAQCQKVSDTGNPFVKGTIITIALLLFLGVVKTVHGMYIREGLGISDVMEEFDELVVESNCTSTLDYSDAIMMTGCSMGSGISPLHDCPYYELGTTMSTLEPDYFDGNEMSEIDERVTSEPEPYVDQELTMDQKSTAVDTP